MVVHLDTSPISGSCFFPSWEEFWVHCAGPKSFDLRVADVCFGGVGLYSGQPLPHSARQEEVRRGVGFLWFKWVVLLLTDFWKMAVKLFKNIQGPKNLRVCFGICSICKIFIDFRAVHFKESWSFQHHKGRHWHQDPRRTSERLRGHGSHGRRRWRRDVITKIFWYLLICCSWNLGFGWICRIPINYACWGIMLPFLKRFIQPIDVWNILESNIGRMYPTWSEGIPFNRYRFDFGIQISDVIRHCLPSQDSRNIVGCFKESTALCLLVFCGWAWPEPFSCEIGC